MAVVLATLVTLAAVVPLAVLAARADDPQPVPEIAEGLWLETNDGEVPLSGASVPEGDTSVAVLVDLSDLSAASWALFEAEGDQLEDGSSTGAAPLALDVALSALEPGVYDLLVSATVSGDDIAERAARFEIGDAK